jgi:hypothetical protein
MGCSPYDGSGAGRYTQSTSHPHYRQEPPTMNAIFAALAAAAAALIISLPPLTG